MIRNKKQTKTYREYFWLAPVRVELVIVVAECSIIDFPCGDFEHDSTTLWIWKARPTYLAAINLT